jgi:hypothetical protein
VFTDDDATDATSPAVTPDAEAAQVRLEDARREPDEIAPWRPPGHI